MDGWIPITSVSLRPSETHEHIKEEATVPTSLSGQAIRIGQRGVFRALVVDCSRGNHAATKMYRWCVLLLFAQPCHGSMVMQRDIHKSKLQGPGGWYIF